MITPLKLRLTVLARLAAASVVTAGLVAGAVAAPASAHPREALDYVALGDSYSAGIGAGQYINECGVSALGFPERLDKRKSIELVENPSCSGATTEDVLSVQLQALEEDTDLVTITIGGNDVGFRDIAIACSADPGSPTCAAQVQASLRTAVAELPRKLGNTFGAIALAAPKAHVVVLGYPQLLSPVVDGAATLNGGVDLLNGLIEQVALTAGFQYVDVTKEFRNHGIGAPDPWIHGAVQGVALHPTAEGYKKGYFKAFKSEVQLNKIQKNSHSYK